MVEHKANQSSVSDEAPFLLIDLRDKQEYDAWHIKEAFNFPLMLINQDKTFPQLHKVKNKADKVIIVYANDEKNGIIGAKTMSDRGYENCCLLNGGIEKFIVNFESLVEGNNVPQLEVMQPAVQQKKRR